jgi:DNA-binding NarL/FixJ family response regulator
MIRNIPGLEVIGSFERVTPAIDFCLGNEADLLILDLQLPDGLGLSVLKTAVRKNRTVNSIILSGHASEFVCPTDLRPNVKAVVDKTQAYGTLHKEIAEIIRPFASSVAHANPWDLLTERERQIYSMVGQGRMSKEIADDLRIAVRTVETHRKAICRKLKVSGSQLVRQAAVHLQTSLSS